jgi:transposase-like protein
MRNRRSKEEAEKFYKLSSSSSIKFANPTKRNEIFDFIAEYKRVTQFIVNELWKDKDSKIPSLIPKSLQHYTKDKTNTWLSVRVIQCSGKQASGIIRGTLKKYKDRLFRLNQLQTDNPNNSSIQKLQKLINETTLSCPELDNITPELDERFITVDMDSPTSFDMWITIHDIGDKKKIIVPLKRTKHFNKMFSAGKIINGARLSNKKLTFNFEFDKHVKPKSPTVGVDVGQITTITCSNGFSSTINNHGYDLNKINGVLSRKKKGSRGFEKASAHRTNYINWSINQLNWSDFSNLNVENLKDVKKGQRTSRKLSHWTYTLILKKLKQKSLQEDVLLKEVNPAFTSQRCNQCGWTQKRNRNGKVFLCHHCGYSTDADFNASINISLLLPPVLKEVRLGKLNGKGFYWNSDTNFYTLLAEIGNL